MNYYMFYILDDNNTPQAIDDVAFADYIREHGDNTRTVGRDYPVLGTLVSTRFLGHNLNGLGTSYPVCFETVILSDNPTLNGHGSRYSTWDHAVEGHVKWCKKVVDFLTGEPDVDFVV